MSRKSDSSARGSNVPQANAISGFAALMDKYRRTLAGVTEEDEENGDLEQTDMESRSFNSDNSLYNETFTQLQIVTFASVIEEALDKIKILGLIGGLPNVQTTLEYHPLSEKYEKEDTQSFIFDPETLEAYEGSTKKQMLIKFQKDRSYIEQVLNEAHDDMISSSSVSKFISRLKQFRLAEDERNNLLNETCANLTTVRRLTTTMDKDKSSLSSNLHKKSEILGKLKDEYEDLIYENDIKYRYIDQWETARCAQNQVDMDRKEDFFGNIIREYQYNYERENRINSEIEAFLLEMDETNTESIEMWMRKYDLDLEAKEIDIQCVKEKRDAQMTTLEALSKLYDQHKKEIEDYLVEKEERLRREELVRKRHAAATKIQAWWRGVMFRKGLGPYKKKRKGKKDKKRKKK